MSLPGDAELAPEFARLSHLTADDLRAEWSHVFGQAAPRNARREYLLRAIAHELQSRTHGPLATAVRRALLKNISIQSPASIKSKKQTRSLKPGARIFREWGGAVHEVLVMDTGYGYRDRTYKSLSVIARQITGTRWSGPVFFGLKNRQQEDRVGR